MEKIKLLCLILIVTLIDFSLNAQKVEILGKVSVQDMEIEINSSENVVRQSDGKLGIRQYKVGDLVQGGIVFFGDESGEHGLVADTEDLSTSMRWYAGTYVDTRAYGDGPYSGEMNTAIIISSQVAIGDNGGQYAARLCSELYKGGYGDWYLPSRTELTLIHSRLKLNGLGGFADDFYWSSTEITDSTVYSLNFTDGTVATTRSKILNDRVRAIRAF